jgi:ribonucleoside-diphosphate reductase alpha chain
LFQGLAPQAPQLPASPTILSNAEIEDESAIPQDQLSRLAEEVSRKLNEVGVQGMGTTSSPAGGIAPEMHAASAAAEVPELKDRGIYHASDAMRDMYDMGDAPSCGMCGAIMVRNGSCYRCMSCGSTSGCS